MRVCALTEKFFIALPFPELSQRPSGGAARAVLVNREPAGGGVEGRCTPPSPAHPLHFPDGQTDGPTDQYSCSPKRAARHGVATCLRRRGGERRIKFILLRCNDGADRAQGVAVQRRKSQTRTASGNEIRMMQTMDISFKTRNFPALVFFHRYTERSI